MLLGEEFWLWWPCLPQVGERRGIKGMNFPSLDSRMEKLWCHIEMELFFFRHWTTSFVIYLTSPSLLFFKFDCVWFYYNMYLIINHNNSFNCFFLCFSLIILWHSLFSTTHISKACWAFKLNSTQWLWLRDSISVGSFLLNLKLESVTYFHMLLIGVGVILCISKFPAGQESRGCKGFTWFKCILLSKHDIRNIMRWLVNNKKYLLRVGVLGIDSG